jgi:hypothetical protein
MVKFNTRKILEMKNRTCIILIISSISVLMSCKTTEIKKNMNNSNSLENNNVEIKVELHNKCVYKGRNLLIFTISNHTENDLFVESIGLGYFFIITDSIGNNVYPSKTYHDRKNDVPDYIFVKSGETAIVKIPTIVFLNFSFEKGKYYTLNLKYYCTKKSRKRKTKYKTLTGVHEVEPFTFKFCD